MNDVERFIEARADLLVERLRRLVEQPTISATGEGMAAGAALVADLAQVCGLKARVVASPGHPYVLGTALGTRADRTLLLTTHYDVQPVGPPDRWESPPFTLVEGPDGLLLGRGSTDAKGAVVDILAAIEAIRATDGALPCNVTVLFDGEEEIGSPSMPWMVDGHRDALHADAAASFDGNSDAGGRPGIYLGSGGLLYLDMVVRTGSRDLHANRGALAPNAAWRLVWALASLKDAEERVTIDGFADTLVPTSAVERAMLAELPADTDAELHGTGVRRLLKGRAGDRIPEALHILPIVNLSGLTSGYGGDGAMTILPAEARAKLYLGLREGQQPEAMLAALRAHLDRRDFDDVELTVLGATEPASCALDSEIALAAERACAAASGLTPAVYPRSHAYGRQGCWIARRLGIDAAHVAAVGPFGARNHSANEFNTRDYLTRGARMMAAVIAEYARPAASSGTGAR